MKNLLAIFSLVFCVTTMKAQTKLDSLKALGRDSLIKLAVKKLNEPAFNPANYDIITVKANSNTLLVEFALSIQFISPGACYYHYVTVALYGHGSGGGITGDCENVKYYNPSASDKKSIDFVFNAINKSEEIGHVPDKKLDPGTTMEITEKPTYYYVEVSSWSTHSEYKVSKATGKISDASHKHYDRSGEGKDEFEEVK